MRAPRPCHPEQPQHVSKIMTGLFCLHSSSSLSCINQLFFLCVPLCLELLHTKFHCDMTEINCLTAFQVSTPRPCYPEQPQHVSKQKTKMTGLFVYTTPFLYLVLTNHFFSVSVSWTVAYKNFTVF